MTSTATPTRAPTRAAAATLSDTSDAVAVRPADSRRRTELVAALDVGGTSIKAGLVARDGTVVREARRPTGVENGPEAVLERILSFAADLVGSADRNAGAVVCGVGVGVPGMVDGPAGIARYAANLGWRDVPLVGLLTERVGLPVALGHDVRLGALAEARRGAGIGADSVYFVAIGTGIAGGLVDHGRVENGAHGQAGEVGHLVVRPGGRACNCGNHGCLETIASASRIGRALAERTGTEMSARDVTERLMAGDQDAREVWDDAIDALAGALTAVTVLSDPGLIVIGGGLSLAGDLLTIPLLAAMARRLTFRTPPPITVSTLGDRAGMLGAAELAWDAASSREGDRP